MDTIKKTGNSLLVIIILLFTVWFMGIAFVEPNSLFHIAGALATILFIFRIIRGDD
jgi:hypothetical protein